MIRLPNGKITIARGPDGTPVGVLDVVNGLSCGCFCPECGQPLIARVGRKRAGHFSHAPGTSACTGMGAWHAMVRDEICRLSQIDLGHSPPVPRLAGPQRILRANKETAVFDGQFRPDAILELQAGVEIAVEVVDTHDIPGPKLAALSQEGWLVLRIDVGAVRASLGSESLRNALAQTLSKSGPWQSWPRIVDANVQFELSFRDGPWWFRVMQLISSPPSGRPIACERGGPPVPQ